MKTKIFKATLTLLLICFSSFSSLKAQSREVITSNNFLWTTDWNYWADSSNLYDCLQIKTFDFENFFFMTINKLSTSDNIKTPNEYSNNLVFDKVNLSDYADVEFSFKFKHSLWNSKDKASVTIYYSDNTKVTYDLKRNYSTYTWYNFSVAVKSNLSIEKVVFTTDYFKKTDNVYLAIDDVTLSGVRKNELKLTPSDVDFGMVPCGDAAEQNLTLTGAGLQSAVSLEVLGDDKDFFKLDKSSVSTNSGSVFSSVSVRFIGGAGREYSARVKATSGTKEAYVNLKANVQCDPISVVANGKEKYFTTFTDALAYASSDPLPLVKLHDNVNQNLVVSSNIEIEGNGFAINAINASGAEVIYISSDLTVDTLSCGILKTNVSQFVFDGTAKLTVNGKMIMDRELYSNVKNKWTPISLPFVPAAISRLTSTGKEYAVKYGTQYMMYQFSSINKAQGLSPWVELSDVSQMLPGYGYMVSTTGVSVLRFSTSSTVVLDGNGDLEIASIASVNPYNSNWVMIGQPLTSNGYMKNNGRILIYDTETDTYGSYNANVELGPTKAVLMQVTRDMNKISFVASDTKYNPSGNPHYASEASEFNVSFGAVGQEYTDALVISADENANPAEYEIGADLLKVEGFAKCALPQIWASEFNQKLCVTQTTINGDVAQVELGLVAPVSGDYTLNMTQNASEGELWLTYGGQRIHNLSQSPYQFIGVEGELRGYGLQIVYAPQVTTDDDMNRSNEAMVFASSGNVNIVNALIGSRVDMYDLGGRLIVSQIVNFDHEVITPELNGVYIIRLTRESEVKTYKIVIK